MDNPLAAGDGESCGIDFAFKAASEHPSYQTCAEPSRCAAVRYSSNPAGAKLPNP